MVMNRTIEWTTLAESIASLKRSGVRTLEVGTNGSTVYRIA